MPRYKSFWIELRTPSQHIDGTWSCRYFILQFDTARWRLTKGCSDGKCSSHDEAKVAALIEAKYIVDSLEHTGFSNALRRYTNKDRSDIDGHTPDCEQQQTGNGLVLVSSQARE